MDNQYYLGVDGGGTKTEVWCANSVGEVVGKGLSGPTNLTTTTVGAASFNLKEAVRQAVQDLPSPSFQTLVMGLAGMDTHDEFVVAHKVFSDVLDVYGIKKVSLVNDSLVALANGSDAENAVILIAGTGSICYGRNDQGVEAKTGGMDFLLTDEGSGYAIGREVLRAAVRSFDGRIKKTVLEKLVTEHFHISSIAEIKKEVYSPLLSKIEVAQLATLATEGQKLGDAEAKRIFTEAIAELELMVVTVVKRLHLEKKAFEVVCSGSVAQQEHVGKHLVSALRKHFKHMTVVFPEGNPVNGALKLALKDVDSVEEKK